MKLCKYKYLKIVSAGLDVLNYFPKLQNSQNLSAQSLAFISSSLIYSVPYLCHEMTSDQILSSESCDMLLKAPEKHVLV